MITRSTFFNRSKVTALIRDGNYVWYAFLKRDGKTYLRKASAFSLRYVYYDLVVPVEKITRLRLSGTNLLLAVEDSSLIAYNYHTNSPLSAFNAVAKPEGIIDSSIDTAITSNRYCILTEGVLEQAKLLIYSTAFVLQATINLGVNNASSMVNEANDLWITTSNTPAELIHVTNYNDVETFILE